MRHPYIVWSSPCLVTRYSYFPSRCSPTIDLTYDTAIAERSPKALTGIMASEGPVLYTNRQYLTGADFSFNFVPGKNNTAQNIRAANTAITTNNTWKPQLPCSAEIAGTVVAITANEMT